LRVFEQRAGISSLDELVLFQIQVSYRLVLLLR
jgi:hypothetical protein